MRPLLLSLKSTWASLYLVITSTNFLDSTACCAGGKAEKGERSKDRNGGTRFANDSGNDDDVTAACEERDLKSCN